MKYSIKILARVLFLSQAIFLPTVAAQQAQDGQPIQQAQQTNEAPDKLIERVSREIIQVVQTDKEVQSGNRKRIQEVVESKILPHVDFELTTALTMGRHWRDATPEQRKRLAEAFRNLLMYTYSGAMSQIKNPTLRFKPLRMAPEETDIEVRSQVMGPRGGNPIDVNYRLRKSADGWKVYDVNVLGIWLIGTYKESFSTEIARSGIDGLIKTLEEKNQKLAANPVTNSKLPTP